MGRRQSINRTFWDGYGISPAGDAQADAAMAKMLEAVKLAGEVAPHVYRAALFQSDVLPTLTPEAQGRFAWKDPAKHACAHATGRRRNPEKSGR